MKTGLIENGMGDDRIDLVPLFSMPAQTVGPGEPGRWLVASRLVHGKGVDMLLRALPMLGGGNWKLVVAGDGPQGETLKALCRELGLQTRVEWLGEISPAALDAQYRRCSLVISPTLRPEPFGLVGPEAMAHGRAVVAFDGGATPEWLTHQQNGWMIRERTSNALARTLQRFLADPELAERMGASALAMHAGFAPQRYLKDLLESFDRTIHMHSRHPG